MADSCRRSSLLISEMAAIRLALPREGLQAENRRVILAGRSYLTTWQGLPISHYAEFENQELRLQPRVGESGYALVPWMTSRARILRLMTATLRVREEPYLLAVELARGTLTRVRAWWDEWNRLEWQIPETLGQLLEEAQQTFIQAVLMQHDLDPANRLAMESISRSLDVIEGLAECYISAMSTPEWRKQHEPPVVASEMTIPFPKGKEHAAWESAFCGAVVRLGSRPLPADQRQWLNVHVPFTIVGPILTEDGILLDDSDVTVEGDDRKDTIPSLFMRISAIEAGRVQLWYAMSGLDILHFQGVRKCSLDERLQQLENVVSSIRLHDPTALVMIGIRHPWGDNLVGETAETPSLEIARHVLRSGLGISALGLEFGVEFAENFPIDRDALAIVDQLDSWAQLQVPLVILLASRQAGGAPQQPGQATPEDTAAYDERLASTLEHWLRLVVHHPAVMAVVWGPWRGNSAGSGEDVPLWMADTGPTAILSSFRRVSQSLRQ